MPKRVDARRREKNGNTPPADTGGTDRLARLLDTPHLAQVVPRLAPEVLHHLIRQRGLNACGAVVAAATPQQIASILDLDLWQSTPGREDQFDAPRFGAWLDALMDEGEGVAARIVGEMDPGLAIAGLSRYVRVFDQGVLSPVGSGNDDIEDLDEASPKPLECTVGGYVVRARTADAWDAIVGLLGTLADGQPACFHALMQGCRRLSNSAPEADGFHTLMLEPEQSLHDVALGREQRRTQQGYLTAGDARAFLQMARQPRPREQSRASSINAIAAAYFRDLDDAARSADRGAPLEERSAGSSADPVASASIDAVVELLADAAIAATRPRALLGPAEADVRRVTPIQPLMEYVRDMDPVAYTARNRELAFLANAMLGGCSVYSRALTVQEGWDAAVGSCNLGLEVWPAGWPGTGVEAPEPDVTTSLPESFLRDHDLVTAFEAGWRLLHEDVGMFVAGQLIAALADLRGVDTATQQDLHRLRRELARHRKAGTPWRAQDRLDVIAILDTPTWACLCGLLSECPVAPSLMGAIVERRTDGVSATAFEWFTTRGQIRNAHEFVGRLRDLLLS